MDFSNLDPYTYRLFQIESNLGQDPRTYSGRNIGLGQFGPDEMRKYGITDPRDPQQQINAVARERAAHAGIFQNRFGSQPTLGQIYLMHQQGAAGGPALMGADPNTPAWRAIRPYYGSDAVAQRAISGNIPRSSPLYGRNVNDITAGDFSNYWINRFQAPFPSAPTGPSLASSGAVAPASATALAPQPEAAPGISPPSLNLSRPVPGEPAAVALANAASNPMNLGGTDVIGNSNALAGATGEGGLGGLAKVAQGLISGQGNKITPAQFNFQPAPLPTLSNARSLSSAMNALDQDDQTQPAMSPEYRQRIIDAFANQGI